MKVNGYTIESGVNLRCADLRSADLRSADLRSADLRYADLSGADLSGADLRYADLRYANLSSANLSGANGIVPLPVAEPRGYRWLAVVYGDGWRILAGCRWFTIDEAQSHWLSPEYKGPSSIPNTLPAALKWLQEQSGRSK